MANINIDNVGDYVVDRNRLIFLHTNNNTAQDQHLIDGMPSNVDDLYISWTIESEGAVFQIIDQLQIDQGEAVGRPSYTTIPDVLYWHPPHNRTEEVWSDEAEAYVEITTPQEGKWRSLRIENAGSDSWTDIQQRIADNIANNE